MVNISKCTGQCGESSRYRTRECNNPTPKYHGRNCSHLGPDREEEFCKVTNCTVGIIGDPRGDSKNKLFYILVPACVVVVCLCGLAFWMHRRKTRRRDDVVPYEERQLTSLNIQELIKLVDTPDEAEILEQIKENIRNFSHCLCSTCIGTWLLDLVKNSGYKENDHLKDQISMMMVELQNTEGYDNLSRACSSHPTGSDHITDIDDSESDQLCIDREKEKLLEQAVDRWVKNNIVYDKLNPCKRTTEHVDRDDGDRRFLFGKFEIQGSKLVPLYDRLGNARVKDDGLSDAVSCEHILNESQLSMEGNRSDELPTYQRVALKKTKPISIMQLMMVFN